LILASAVRPELDIPHLERHQLPATRERSPSRARIEFTGSGLPPKELPDDAAVKKAVAADPKAVGYISKSNVDSTVKVVLELD
jgi:hypothetical protein